MKHRILLTIFFAFICAFGFAGNFYINNFQDTLTGRDTAFQKIRAVKDSLMKNKADSNNSGDTTLGFNQVFKPYKSFVKNTSIESTTDLTIQQQNVSYKTKADFATKYTLNNVLPDNYNFNVSIIKLNTKVETMGLQLQYDSRDSVQTDTTSGFAKPLFDIVGKDIQVKVDTTGKILSVDTSEINGKVQNVLSSLSIVAGDAYKIGENFGLLYSKDVDSLQLGNSWNDSVETPVGKTVSKYIVQSLLHNEIVLMVQGDLLQNGTFWSSGNAYKTDFTGTQIGKIVIARDSRLIKQRNITYNLHGTVHYSGNDIPATAVSRVSESLNPQ